MGRQRKAREPEADGEPRWDHAPRDPDAAVARAQDELGVGDALDAELRPHMESGLGRDLSGVRVHTDEGAARVARSFDAEALTAGSHVVFANDRYHPGTPMGDALIAHELAHVAQQEEAGGALASSAALEQDADHRAAGVVASRWPGLRALATQIGGAAGRRRVTGPGALHLAACFGPDRKLEKPDFLGPESERTFETIRTRLESADLLEDMLIAGPLIVLLTSSPLETAAGGGYPLEEQVRAVQAVDVIVRQRIIQDIELLLVTHGNDLTEEETAYWERLLRVLRRSAR